MTQNHINTNDSHNEIHWKDGKISKQLTPFEWHTNDWNNDGDVYDEYGAVFEGRFSDKEFFPKWQLEDLIAEGKAIIKDGELL